MASTIFAQKKGEKLNEGRIQQLVHDARKTQAREFRATSRDNEQDMVVIDAPTGPHIQDHDGITLKQHIDRLQILMKSFQPILHILRQIFVLVRGHSIRHKFFSRMLYFF